MISLPVILYQAYAYMLPALTDRERRAIVPFLVMVPVLFCAGVVFGPKRLPELGKSMGKGIREFKGSLSMDDDDEIPAESPPKPIEAVDGEVVNKHKAA